MSHAMIDDARPRTWRRWRSVAGLVAVGALVATGMVATDTGATLSDGSVGTLDDVPGTLPGSLGDVDLASLQYGDPAENLAVLPPPEANNDGSARLSLPLLIPPGRAGVQPDLVLGYDSEGGTSWLGRGWDLSLGAVTIDTTFGAPRFHGTLETETYALDGDTLFPNAVRPGDALAARVVDRSDFVRQVEGPFERIIRHGTGPGDYHWQVTDKDGTDRWYGGSPDGRHPGSILSTAGGNDVHWALRYVEDISGNTMTFAYDKASDVPIGKTDTNSPGVSLYPASITYTGFDVPVDVPSAAVDDPAHRIEFDTSDGRPDVTVDARSGVPIVTDELLDEIRILHLPEGDGAPELVGGYRFAYREGPFDKTLLDTIGQVGTDGEVFAEHQLGWHDDLTSRDGTDYGAFSDPVRWDTTAAGDDPDDASISATSAISTSNRLGGDGGAYIGFNPVAPQKTLSVGGSFNISGGGGEVLSSLLDLDGDGLPDKVLIKDGAPHWQRNVVTPEDELTDGAKFGAAQEISGIDEIGQTRDFRVDLALEAYPIASVQVGGGFGFSYVDRYFQDVNSDGRPDFVQATTFGGTVYFNTLVPKDGGGHDVQFVAGSNQTSVPLETFEAAEPSDTVRELADAAQPHIDTVRRWVAPFDGTVDVTGTAAIVDPDDYAGDGVQVSIASFSGDDTGGVRRFVTTLDETTTSAPHAVSVPVSKGDQLFFRVHGIDDVTDDEVSWAPVVTYTDLGAEVDVADDANGRSQLRYAAAEEFTTFGRTGSPTNLLDPGPGTLEVTLDRVGDLSDDVHVRVRFTTIDGDTETTSYLDPAELGGLTTGPVDGAVTALEAGGPGGGADQQVLTYTFDASEIPDQEEPDRIELEVLTDTPVDPTALGLGVSLETTPGPDGETRTREVVLPSVRVFARDDGLTPYQPWTPDEGGEHTLSVDLRGPKLVEQGDPDADLYATPAVLSVKREVDGVVEVVARERFTVSHATDDGGQNFRLRGDATLDFTAEADTPHWLEVSAHQPGIAARLFVAAESITPPDPDDQTTAEPEDVDVRLHRPAVQGTFPSDNRGWSLAGYNADHEDSAGADLLVASQFQLQVAAVDGELDEDVDPEAIAEGLSVDQLKGQAGELDVRAGYQPSVPYLPWSGPEGGPADRWRSAESSALFGTADVQRASRVGVDLDIGSADPATGAGTRPAIRQTSSTGDFAIALGLGPASISAAFGAGGDITAFEDLNGDGFPDIREATSVQYTGPRGDKALEKDDVLEGRPRQQTISVGGGLGGSPVKAQVSRATGSTRGDGVSKGGSSVAPTTKSKQRGANIGLSLNFQGSWTNPLPASQVKPYDADDEAAAAGILDDLGAGEGTLKERALADMNGDGIPDLVTSRSTGALEVQFGTGYGYTDSVIWADGTFNATKDVNGSLGLGFQIVNYEFGGGAGGAEAVSLAEMQWADVDGDGVLDQLTQLDTDGPELRFGSGEFPFEAAPVDYGTFPTGSIDFVGNNGNLPDAIGERAAFSRSTSASGGFDFSVYIGPICVVACYIIINPGAHFGGDRSTTEISLEDMNGDGYLDVVHSKSTDDVRVHLNTAGRTNLLQSVTTPLGAEYEIGYERHAPTVDQPESLWVMSQLTVDDNRAGDGEDVQLSRFTYEDNRYDRLLRTMLGFRTVTEDVLTPGPDPDDHGDDVLERSVVGTYRNATPFDAGLLEREELRQPDGTVREASTQAWELRQVDGVPVDLGSDAVAIDEPGRTALFDVAFMPLPVEDSFTRWDAEGDPLAQRVTMTYDDRGNMLSRHDHNQGETTDDDAITRYAYPAGCGVDRAAGDTWVQVPERVTVEDSAGTVLRERDGSLDICANAVPIRIVEQQGTDACGDPRIAVTELAFDAYGSYGAMLQPSNAVRESCDDPAPVTPPEVQTFFGCTTESGTTAEVLQAAADRERLCLDYAYDDRRFTEIADVTDSHGITATSTYDPLTGRLSTETDPNGNTSLYCYDAQGRLAAIVAPRELGAAGLAGLDVDDRDAVRAACAAFTAGDAPTVRYRYSLVPGSPVASDAHAWATAAHHDQYSPEDSIDTAAFVDGIGRVVQRKRDADVDVTLALADATTVQRDEPVRVVEGAVEYDALGREVKEWYPVVELHEDADLSDLGSPPDPAPARFDLTEYNTLSSEVADANQTFVPVTEPTVVGYDVFDRVVDVELPDDTTVQIGHDATADPVTGLVVAARTTMDPVGRTTTLFKDVRGATLTVREAPAPVTASGELELALPGTNRGDPRIAASESTDGTPLQTVARYDPLGRLVEVTDTGGAVTTHAYDMLDNRTSTTTPDGGTMQRVWTPAGQVASEADQKRLDNGQQTWFRYDRDRLEAIDYPDVALEDEPVTPDVAYEFGAAGAAGNAAGRVVEVVDGAMTRSYAYDVDGNVAEETAQRRTDPFDRGEVEVQPEHVTSFAHDSLQRLRTLTYPDGEVVVHDFDRGGSVAAIRSTMPQPDVVAEDGTPTTPPDRSFTYLEQVDYDEFGAVVRLETGTGVVSTYDHDPTRRFLTAIDTDAVPTEQYDGTTSEGAELQRLRYQYDDVGNVLASVNRLYTAEDASELAPGDAIVANGLPGPSAHVHAYDGHYRLTASTAAYVDRTEDRFLDYASDYAPNGTLQEKTQVARTVGTTGSAGDDGTSGGGNGNGNGGNSKKNKGDDVEEDSTTPNQCDDNQGSGGGVANQDPELTYTLARGDLEYEAAHQLSRAGSRTYEHDANGSLTRWVQPCANSRTEDVRQLTWDADNRLVRIAQGTLKSNGRVVENATTEYRYNAEGERALERRPSDTFFVNRYWRVEGGDRQFASVYLGDDRVAMHRTVRSPDLPDPAPPCEDPDGCTCDPAVYRCAEQDVEGATCPTVEEGVVRTDDGFCQPLHREQVRFMHPDATGSMRVATDAVGRVFQYVDYTPTGRPWVAGQSSIHDTPYLFAGGWTDTQFDLVNFGERWYDAREEQFYSVEPLLDEDPTVVLDDPSIQSAYTYANSNPLKFVDTDGRRARYDRLWTSSGGGFNTKLSQDQIDTLQDVPAFTYTPKDKRRLARSKPGGGGPFTNDRATLNVLTGETGSKAFNAFVKGVNAVDDFSLFTIRLKESKSGSWSGSSVRPFNVPISRYRGGKTATGGANPQGATSPQPSTGASQTSAPTGGPPPRPSTPPPPATTTTVTPPQAGSPAAAGPP